METKTKRKNRCNSKLLRPLLGFKAVIIEGVNLSSIDESKSKILLLSEKVHQNDG